MDIRKWICIIVTLCISASTAFSAGINWIDFKKAEIKYDGFKEVRFDNIFHAKTFNPVYPQLDIRGISINAEENRFLYIKLASGDRYLRIYFPHDPEILNFDVKAHGLKNTSDPVYYRLDLEQTPAFEGNIKNMTLEFMGHSRGEKIILEKVGFSADNINRINDQQVNALNVDNDWQAHDRMAIWQDAIVRTNDTVPNSLFMTYIRDIVTPTHGYVLAKIVPGVKISNEYIWTDKTGNVAVTDFPGGVKAEYYVRGVKITTEIIPLMHGRDSADWNGKAVFSITTEPRVPVKLKIGGGAKVYLHDSIHPGHWTVTEKVTFPGTNIDVHGKKAYLTNPSIPLHTGFRSNENFTKENDNSSSVIFDTGRGQLYMTFAEDEKKNKKLLSESFQNKTEKAKDYYQSLLDNANIDTPVDTMDRAFENAVILMDYSWYSPFGWIESPHHWPQTFHLQHTVAEQWLDHSERVKDSLLLHAENVLPSGKAPSFAIHQPIGSAFGGSNQYYFWEVDNYYDHTGDKNTLEKLAPAMDKMLNFVKKSYDPDNDLLFSWGFQIGNQEDMICTPYAGTAPTIEAINIMKTREKVARILGDNQKVDKLKFEIAKAKTGLKQNFWMNDLGRFLYYIDPDGYERFESQYHSYIYPAIYDITDKFDSWTSMRHLRDRLMGEKGEVYLSNNFADHLEDIWSTWGMQTGAAQQPWGSFGLSEIGLNNEVYKPLKAIADVVINDHHRGSWPEVMYENRLGYFSPPAGLYIQSVIEAVFGLKLKKPESTLQISPSFPESWPKAHLKLPAYEVDYKRDNNKISYTVTSNDKLKRRIKWHLPPANIEYVKANGKEVNYSVEPAIKRIILKADLPAQIKTRIEISYKPLHYNIEHPASVAQGQPFELISKNITLNKVIDRNGVLSKYKINTSNTLKAKVSKKLLDKYLHFGKIGKMNFSRRSFFVNCKNNDISFWHPVDLIVLQPYEAEIRTIDKSNFSVLIRNNTSKVLSGEASLNMGSQILDFDINIKARSQNKYQIEIGENTYKKLSTGVNITQLVLPAGSSLDVKFNINNAEQVNKRMQKIDLPENMMIPSTSYKDIRKFYFHGYLPDDILQGLKSENYDLKISQLSQVPFKIQDKKFIPVSQKIGQSKIKIDMQDSTCRKIYLLVIPFIDNHDSFSKIARIKAELVRELQSSVNDQVRKAFITKMLYTPGDLDYWYPKNYMAHLSTFKNPRKERFSLLPLLNKNESDWKIAKPPMFPQPAFWSESLAYDVGTSIINVIELNLNGLKKVRSLQLETLGTDSALGLIAVTCEK